MIPSNFFNFDKMVLNLRLETASISSVPTVSTSRLDARKRFDDRSQTAIAVSLRSFGSMKPARLDRFSDLASECNRMANVMKWSETVKISRSINSALFLSKFGSATVLVLSQTHILVGTSKGAVAAFDYTQRLNYALSGCEPMKENPRVSEPPEGSGERAQNTVYGAYNTPVRNSRHRAPVTCLAFSSDGLFVSAGHMDGTITLWDVSKATLPEERLSIPMVLDPYNIIHTSDPNDRNSERVSHYEGVPIVSVAFLDELHLFLISSDLSGHVLYHHGFKKFLRKHLLSEVILKVEKNTQNKFFECQSLPVGTSAQVTDLLGVTAVITNNYLRIFSVKSLNNTSSTKVITHFKMSRPKAVELSSVLPSFGCLAWYPCLKEENGVLNAKLACSWNNVVKILEINNSGIPPNILDTIADVKDKDKALPIIPIFETARWHTSGGHERVVALKWLNSETLTVLVQNDVSTEFQLRVLYYSSFELNAELRLVGLDHLNSQQVSSLSLASVSNLFMYTSYQSSFQILRHRPILLANSHTASEKAVFTGTNLKWADRLMQLLVRKDFLAALLAAYDFYCSKDSGKLILCGLPHIESERHKVVEPFLVNIMKESIKPLFSNSGELSVEYELPKLSYEDLLQLYFHLVTTLTQNRGGPIEQGLLDIMEEIWDSMSEKNVYFAVLEDFILSQKIPNLSPILLERLIEYFVDAGISTRVTEIVCLLDSSTLNIDYTLKICKKHSLRECSTYIWNKLLHDYITPFKTLVEDLGLPGLVMEQKNLVYTYLAYVLSGRQFPTDDYLSEEDETRSRKEICTLLFSYTLEFSEESLFLDSSAVFPWLTHLLKFNVGETLMTINEYFENPCLNDEEQGYDRQYIIEALLDIFVVQKSFFLDQDNVFLSIFIARNYPKFVQFIRLSDTVLQATLMQLCQNKDLDLHDDCELALQSLIQAYDVGDEGYFLEQLKAAGFNNALFTIYKQKGDYSKAVEVWLKGPGNVENDGMNFSILAEILEATFVRSSGTPEKRSDVLAAIEHNFEELVRASASDMLLLANTYCTKIHEMVLQCKDEKIAFEYLKRAFNGPDKAKIDQSRGLLLSKYVLLLSIYEPESVMDTVKKNSATLQKYFEEDNTTFKMLSNNGHIDAACFFLVQNGHYEEALDQLLKGIESEASGDEVKLDRYIDAATDVCEHAGAELWTVLVLLLVQLTNTSAKYLENLNQGIYRSFRRLLDSNPEKETFQNVLHKIMESAQVSNVRSTLQDVLTSYFFEIEMLTISLNKINHAVLKYMHKVRRESLEGWNIGKMSCASCSLPICGKDISLSNYIAWEDRERERVMVGSYNKDEYIECEIVLFKCFHGYHGKCLRGLSSWDQCVLCENLQPKIE